jgi:thiamine biosynthesis lipoprotein
MGSNFEITVVALNEEMGYINIEEAAAEVKRIEQLISSWIPESETSMINQSAGIKPVAVSLELYNLIERSLQLSELTAGAFDITFASFDTVWTFDGSMRAVPSTKELDKIRTKGGYHNIILDPENHSVFLKYKGMRINFGAVGKGYAADKAKALLVSKQVPAGLINASGDITAWGIKATGDKWLIGVANPTGNGNLVTWIPLVESSVAISGNQRRYVSVGGKQYGDILNPVTGLPSEGVTRVTVFGKMAEFCDALATAITVIGAEDGLALVNQLGDTEAIIEGEGGELYHSKGLLLKM